MDLGELIPIIAIIATAVVLLSLIRFRRERLHADAGGAQAPGGPRGVAAAEENARLAHENEALRLTVRRLEERMSVLEAIATDPAERTAREIENLR